MLQAMNTGHDGSLTTSTPTRRATRSHRLETLVLMAGVELPIKAIREQIAGGFDLLVHIGRLVDGSRRVTQITEIVRHGRRRHHPPGSLRRPCARAWNRTAPGSSGRSLDRPSARFPVQARRQRRRAGALGVAECRVRKLLAALALGALLLPASAVGSRFERRPDPPGRRQPVPARAGDGSRARGQPPDPHRRRPPGRVRQGSGARRRPGDGAGRRQLGVDDRPPAPRGKAGRDGVPVQPAPRRRRRSRRLRARGAVADSAPCWSVQT